MQDLKAKREKLLVEAADCEMIGNLATDQAKREMFRKLAADLRMMVADLDAAITAREAGSDGSYASAAPGPGARQAAP